jgi:hypothetical protein
MTDQVKLCPSYLRMIIERVNCHINPTIVAIQKTIAGGRSVFGIRIGVMPKAKTKMMS